MLIKDIIKMEVSERDELITIAYDELVNQKKLRLAEELIEKDLWVTFMLQVIFQDPELSEAFCFKGGTSLSKGFDVIQRFSEDIDLILKWGVLGYDSETVHYDRTNRQQVLFDEKIRAATGEWVQSRCIPLLQQTIGPINKDVHFSVAPEDPSTVIVDYPHSPISGIEYFKPSIRLEIGTLSAMTPAERVPITSLLSEAVSFHETLKNDSFKVPTIAPERTFWEKATILHAVANKKKVPKRYSRHYYDLYALGHNKKIKEQAFNQKALLRVVVDFKNKFYHSFSANYATAETATIRLVPDEEQIELLKADFVKMQEMFFGEAPTFDEIISYLTKLEAEIHQL